jgi:hypothetical protein
LNFNTAADAPLTNIPQTPNASKEFGIVGDVTGISYQSPTLSTGSYDLLASFVTDVNTPSSTTIPAGIWDFNIFVESTTTNSANQVYFKVEVLKYNGANAPTLLATSNDVYIYDPAEINQQIASVVMPQTTILATDRIVIYLYGRAHQNNNQLTFHFGGNYPSHTHSTIPSVTGTGVVKVVNGVFQSPASTIVNADVSATAAINVSKLSGVVAKTGDTMTGKLIAAADATISKLNIGNALSPAANPTTTVDGDVWINNGNRIAYKANSSVYTLAPVNSSNSFTAIQSVEVTSASTAFRITQKGTGEAFRVEDDPTTPDTTPFVISNAGRVGIGVTPDATVALSVDTTGLKFGDGTIQTTAVTGGGSITPGIIDNAVLRANGTSGTLLKNSDILIDDAATATQNNVAIVNNHQQTDSCVVITPKGYGAFILGQKPNGSTGGDARGLYAIDLQLTRDPASPTQVASGVQSVCVGSYNTALSDYGVAIGVSNSSDLIGSIAIGSTNNSINDGSISIGTECVSEGQYSTALGSETNASGNYSLATGYRSSADRYGQVAFANGRFTAIGDAQNSRFILRGQSTNTTARNLTLTGASTSGFLGIPVGKVMAMTINIAGISSLGAVAHYVRQYAVRNLLGTSTQVYAPVTIGTDFASGTSIALSVNDPDDTIRIVVTGTSGPTYWRWVATIDAVEIGI